VTCIGRAFPEKDFLDQSERLNGFIPKKKIRIDFIDKDGAVVATHRLSRAGNWNNPDIYVGGGVVYVPQTNSNDNGRPNRQQLGYASFCSPTPVHLGGVDHLWRAGTNALILPSREIRVSGVLMFQLPEQTVRSVSKISVRVASE
jgi:hypothetical protein